MTNARIGWGGQVHLSTDNDPANYFQLVEAISFALPDEQAAEVKVTHLASPDRREEYISGLTDGGSIDVEFNYAPGSPTDIAIRNAKDAGDTRAVKFVVPDKAGDPEWKIETFAFVKGYKRGPIVAGDVVKATVSFRVTGAATEGTA